MSQLKKCTFLVLLFVLLALTAACQPQVVTVDRQSSAFGALSASSTSASAPPPIPEVPYASLDISQQIDTETASQARLIIRTANLSLIVTDTEASITTVTEITNGRGGWIVNSSTAQAGDGVRGDMTIRVPAEDFDAILTDVKDQAIEVTRESITGQDVTEEYVDYAARLDNLEATADRVRGFLEEAGTVEEALLANTELSRLEGEIESLKGRLQYLSQSAAFSTITINFIPDALNQPIEVAGWRPQGVARDAIETLIETLQIVASIVIWFVLYIFPLLIVVGLPLYFFVRWLIRRRRTRRAAANATTAAD